MTSSPSTSFHVGKAQVEIYPSKLAASAAAAMKASSILSAEKIASDGRCFRIVVGTGNSQEEMVKSLVQDSSIEWDRVEVFHMDEYVGMPATHPASFRRWVKTRLVDVVHPAQVHYLNGDALDLNEECLRYENLLHSSPIDICFLGFGENGHIAFNDPHVADFHDPVGVKRVRMDERCQRQQVGEGHFHNLESVPKEALTVTCPLLISARYLICCVPEQRKAEAVRNALEGPVSPACPASLVRRHPQAFVFLDLESASLLSFQGEETGAQSHSGVAQK